MARNFTGTATTTAAEVTIDGALCSQVYVKNTGGVDLYVNVPRVHGDDDYDIISSGETEYYSSTGDIKNLYVKTASGTCTYQGGAVRGTA